MSNQWQESFETLEFLRKQMESVSTECAQKEKPESGVVYFFVARKLACQLHLEVFRASREFTSLDDAKEHAGRLGMKHGTEAGEQFGIPAQERVVMAGVLTPAKAMTVRLPAVRTGLEPDFSPANLSNVWLLSAGTPLAFMNTTYLDGKWVAMTQGEAHPLLVEFWRGFGKAGCGAMKEKMDPEELRKLMDQVPGLFERAVKEVHEELEAFKKVAKDKQFDGKTSLPKCSDN